jgi:hypothetical protein
LTSVFYEYLLNCVIQKEKDFIVMNDLNSCGYIKLKCEHESGKEFTQVEGLAKHLRCVGIDAAVPNSKKPEPR